jgi:hypothetical protein
LEFKASFQRAAASNELLEIFITIDQYNLMESNNRDSSTKSLVYKSTGESIDEEDTELLLESRFPPSLLI